MTNLVDLIYSLTTVIIGYHDSQGSVMEKQVVESNKRLRLEKTRAKAIEIINAESPKFDKKLEELIKKCTDGYPLRQPFLSYILNQVKFLYTTQDRLNSLPPDLLNIFKAELTRMLIDFQRLVTTLKCHPVKQIKHCVPPSEAVSDSNNEVTLSGLKNDSSYYGGEFCNSGELLYTEVLLRAHITTETPQETIALIANDLCNEHLNTFLVPELSQKRDTLLVKISELESELETLKQAVATSKDELKLQTEQTETLRVTVSELKSGNETLEQAVATSKGELKLQTEQTEILRVTVSELKSGNETLEQAVATSKGELKLQTEQTETLRVTVSELKSENGTLKQTVTTLESLTAQLSAEPNQSAEDLALKLTEAEKRIKELEMAQQKQSELIEEQKSQLQFQEFNKALFSPYNRFFGLPGAQRIQNCMGITNRQSEPSSQAQSTSDSSSLSTVKFE